MNTGIKQKMEMDVQPDKHFWTRPKIQEADTPLTISHLLLPFIFLAGALVFSMMTFCIEKNGRKMGHSLREWLRMLTRARHIKNQTWAMRVPHPGLVKVDH